jgi:starch phosphorylase
MTLTAERSGYPFHPAQEPRIAYFSMEIALDPAIPTYSGGLGILAGDTIRSAADLEIPMVAVTLAHRQGYFRQRLDAQGNQIESEDEWSPGERLERVIVTVHLTIEGRRVRLGAWKYICQGATGHQIPVYLLDSSLPENSDYDQTLTDRLYGGDSHYRLCQEAVLGMGGVAMLGALGHAELQLYHMNEGHSALLILGLLENEKAISGLGSVTPQDIERTRRKCVFTTHTPVPAGHDQFTRDLMWQILGEEAAKALDTTQCCEDGSLNMTFLALRCSHFVNGVAMRHGEISQDMYPGYPVRAITNGVHAATWIRPPMQVVLDSHIPQWRRDSLQLRYVMGISLEEIRAAHLRAKRDLIQQVRNATGVRLEAEVFTIGFARRATAYKRADLIFHDADRLRAIVRNAGAIQIVMGGKAHPLDGGGKELIRRVFAAASGLKDDVKVAYIENYDMTWAKYLCSGVDLWLNTPKRPHEASGTSGMKAAMNGVPSFSVLDGWWVEGHIEGVTGWSIGDDGGDVDDTVESGWLYDKLEQVILPLYYGQPDGYAKVMRSAIALNGAYFNTQRMVWQYALDAYSARS